MSRFSSILRPDALLFVAIAAVFWLVMSVSKANTSRIVTVTLSSEQRIVGDQWLMDTSATMQVSVAAQGIGTLGLRKLDGTQLSLPVDFFQSEKNQVRVKGSDLVPRLTDVLGTSSIQVLDEFIYFPSHEVVQRLKPIEVKGLDKIVLPSGYGWIDSPRIEPLLLELQGEASVLESTRLHIDLKPTSWEGAMGIRHVVKGIPPGVRASTEEVVVLGHSALWADRKFIIEKKEGPRLYTIEVWLSGPVERLKTQKIEELGNLIMERQNNQIFLTFEPSSKHVKVLNISPSSFPNFKS